MKNLENKKIEKCSCPLCGKELVLLNEVYFSVDEYEFWCDECKLNIVLSHD